MRNADIAIVGGGLAGSLAAAMLGLAGFDVVLIDPHPVYPPDFRCEKLDSVQTQILEKTGLAEAILRAGTLDGQTWVARFGRVIDKRAGDQYGIMYDTLVNTLRAQIPDHVRFIEAKAKTVLTGADRQTVALSTGEVLSVRLVVLATGLNIAVRQSLGIEREVISPNHSVSIGFDMVPIGRPSFDFPALTYYAERPADRIALLTLFPIRHAMRANLFVYRDLHDPWLRQMREAPQETLFAALPGLRKVTGEFGAADFIKIRPVDLYLTKGYRQAGVVLVGDAFSTSCPAAGTGARKVLNDVERLCNLYIPQWMATPGMGTDKIAAFYDDPVKVASDAFSFAKAYSLRSFSTDTGIGWAARRWAKFVLHWSQGAMRSATRTLDSAQPSLEAATDRGISEPDTSVRATDRAA